ncbi:hypothetical protein [Prevotella sp. P6B4]|uniref:hypothetical protein n=1 Tax=Prevotella sp. P6B4 TaxID=1410614 RepID=UPI0012DCF4EA|nr:hypothetical protein [Prevotella sp. P6B4]
MANETIFARQDNKVVAVADSTRKESTGKESKTLSEKDAKVIRKFLQEVGPYEADALRIAIAMADGKVDITTLTSDEQLALNRFMNNGVNKGQSDSWEVEFHRSHRALQLCKRMEDYCNELQLLTIFVDLTEFAFNTAHVEEARAGLEKIAGTRTGQSILTSVAGNSVTK